jgi:trehalose 6-phosphate phosphatase
VPVSEPTVVLSRENLDAVIFDLDGVVTDTASVHQAAWKRLFDDYLEERAARTGEPFAEFTPEDYRRYVDGKPRYDGVRAFLASRGIEVPEGDPSDPPGTETVCGLGNTKNERFLTTLREDGIEVFASTVDLVKALQAAGFHTAIISASKNAGPVLEAAGLGDLFDHRVDGLEQVRMGFPGKPDPAVFLEAARRLGVDPSRAAIVEDALAGVEAGRDGGFGLVIGVDRSGDPEGLRRAGADVVVTDLREVAAPPGGTERGMRDLPSALDRGDQIAARLTGRPVAVFLDYDGTLSPIVDRPEAAVLPEATRAALVGLAQSCPVAIVSGRDLEDVRKRADVPGVLFAGSHGFEIAGPDGSHTEYEAARRFLPALDAAEEDLRRGLAGVEGVEVERKRYAIAVHYRRADPSDVPRVERVVRDAAARQEGLRASGGKKVFELRPEIEWHKGKAVMWLSDTVALGDDAVLVYVGDDVTDEDAFRELRGRGIGVIVLGEDDRITAAEYSLSDTEEVSTFLERLADLVSPPK